MCNAIYAVSAKAAELVIKESAKKAEREAIRAAAGLGHSAEAVRRTEEDMAVIAWADEENRKIANAHGATEVIAGAAGVEIDVLTSQWTQATVDLFGARNAIRRKHSAAGDVREASIESLKTQRLLKSAKADIASWALEIGSAFVQGVYMEKKIFGTTDKTFGIDVSSWFKGGEYDMPKKPGYITTEEFGPGYDAQGNPIF